MRLCIVDLPCDEEDQASVKKNKKKFNAGIQSGR